MNFLDKIGFHLRTGHSFKTYQKLFRDLSNLYLNRVNPGRTKFCECEVEVVTSGQCLEISVGGTPFLIERSTLRVLTPKEEIFPLCDNRLSFLREIFDHWIANGLPFKMSDTNVSYIGI